MGAGFEAAERDVRGCPHVAHILEPRTLNSFELFSVAKFYLDLVSVVRPGDAVARTLHPARQAVRPSSRWAIVAIVNSLLHGTTVW